MKDFKVRCIDDSGHGWIKGKTYSFANGVAHFEDGTKAIGEFNSVEDLNSGFVSQFELVGESSMFKKGNIKVGYVLELNNSEDHLVMVLPGKCSTCISGTYDWWDFDEFEEDLVYKDSYITKIYGFATNDAAYKLSTEDRELLWERKPAIPIKEMTVAEISAALGYDVKIVKEAG